MKTHFKPVKCIIDIVCRNPEKKNAKKILSAKIPRRVTAGPRTSVCMPELKVYYLLESKQCMYT